MAGFGATPPCLLGRILLADFLVRHPAMNHPDGSLPSLSFPEDAEGYRF
jgi:hypothetical protein